MKIFKVLFLLLLLAAFQGIFSSCSLFEKCEIKGQENLKFQKTWKIISYIKNGKDLLDSLVILDTLQNVTFSIFSTSDRKCYNFKPSGFIIFGISPDQRVQKQLRGAWSWNESLQKLDLYRYELYYIIDSSGKFISKNLTYGTMNAKLPFEESIQWDSRFNGDTLSLKGNFSLYTLELKLLSPKK